MKALQESLSRKEDVAASLGPARDAKPVAKHAVRGDEVGVDDQRAAPAARLRSQRVDTSIQLSTKIISSGGQY
eukprot:464080-Pleurochrysis_carterae.AAC.5